MRSVIRCTRAVLIACAVTIILPGATNAEFPNHGVFLGCFGSYTLNLDGWNLGNAPEVLNSKLQPGRSSPGAGLHLGYHFISQLIGEVGGEYIAMTSTAGIKNTGIKADIDLYFHFLNRSFSPILGIGAGAYATIKGGDLGGDMDMQLHGFFGVRGLITQRIGLRAEVRDNLVENYTSFGWGHNLGFSAGIDFYLYTGPKMARDSDHDGIFDSSDACPEDFGSVSSRGCPDRDNDSIADEKDNCPDIAGVPQLQGCPDKDYDGIIDSIDICPDIAGVPQLQGCPDRDNDGITDAKDKCPDVQGTMSNEGCPLVDGDNDGVVNDSDMCPEAAGSQELCGCPDTDGDGIADNEDKCPDVAGMGEYEGCIPDELKRFTGVIKGINFKSGSATILASSFELLNRTAAILNEYKSIRIRIGGHTDQVGNAANNKKLSAARAESVKEYLLSKNIDAHRLETVGYGDSKPVGDNRTAEGRAANRRIEIAIIGQ